jgi:hypothetical protein
LFADFVGEAGDFAAAVGGGAGEGLAKIELHRIWCVDGDFIKRSPARRRGVRRGELRI